VPLYRHAVLSCTVCAHVRLSENPQRRARSRRLILSFNSQLCCARRDYALPWRPPAHEHRTTPTTEILSMSVQVILSGMKNVIQVVTMASHAHGASAKDRIPSLAQPRSGRSVLCVYLRLRRVFYSRVFAQRWPLGRCFEPARCPLAPLPACRQSHRRLTKIPVWIETSSEHG